MRLMGKVSPCFCYFNNLGRIKIGIPFQDLDHQVIGNRFK